MSGVSLVSSSIDLRHQLSRVLIDVSISQFRFHFGVTWDFIFRNSSSFWFSAHLLCCLHHLLVGNFYHRAESLEGFWSHLSVTWFISIPQAASVFKASSHRSLTNCDVFFWETQFQSHWCLVPCAFSITSRLPLSLPTHSSVQTSLRALVYIWNILAHVGSKVW